MKKLWRAVLGVAAAAFGVRSQASHRSDWSEIPFSAFVLAAVLFTAAFIALLILVVRWVTA